MLRTLLISAVPLLFPIGPSAVGAAPTLLFQLKHVAPPPIFVFGPPPDMLDFYFAVVDIGVGGDPAKGLRWTTTASALDVGTTYFATAEQVGDLNSVIHKPLFLGAQIQTSDSSFSYLFSDAVQDSPLHNGNSTLQVDLQVPALNAYVVTSVERSIDSFYLEEIPFGTNRAYHYGGAQTLSVYGTLIPEPTTSIPTILALAIMCSARIRRSEDNSELR